MTQKNYDDISDVLVESAKSTAEQSMNNAANELHKKTTLAEILWERRFKSICHSKRFIFTVSYAKVGVYRALPETPWMSTAKKYDKRSEIID